MPGEGTRTQQVSSWNHIMFGGNVHAWVYSTLAVSSTHHVSLGPFRWEP